MDGLSQFGATFETLPPFHLGSCRKGESVVPSRSFIFLRGFSKDVRIQNTFLVREEFQFCICNNDPHVGK